MDKGNVILVLSLILSGIAIFRYLFYLSISPLYDFHKEKLLKDSRNLSKSKIEKRTKISVIVPAWNEEVGIITSIESLLRNSYKNLEIIVVNDGSTDNTNKVVKEYYNAKIKNNDLKGKTFVYINKKKNKGKGAAINSGIKKSTGDLIITMDADTKFEKDAIFTVARYFQNKDIDAAVGNVKVASSSSVIGIIQQIEYTLGFYFKRTNSIIDCEYIIGGAFGIFRRSVFDKCGYFDENNRTEDIEFSTRIKSFGLKTAYIEDAIAYTEGADSILGLLKQRLRWKKGRMDTFIRYPDMFLSCKKEHNFFLSWIVLPIALIGDLELILFPILTPIVFYYTFTFSNFNYWFAWIFFSPL
jgi:cellulose synthase/poly-beta-1,6-N-acetylglucosamine synthase-like glycosyltransferase